MSTIIIGSLKIYNVITHHLLAYSDNKIILFIRILNDNKKLFFKSNN